MAERDAESGREEGGSTPHVPGVLEWMRLIRKGKPSNSSEEGQSEQFFRLAGERGSISEDPERVARFAESMRTALARYQSMFASGSPDGSPTRIPGISAEPEGLAPLSEAERGARNARLMRIFNRVTGSPELTQPNADTLGKLTTNSYWSKEGDARIYGPVLPPNPSSGPGPKGGKP